MERAKDLNMALYFDYYGEFLTEKQQRVFEMYYNDDFSLAEIGQQLNISRQGVADILKRASAKLKDMEQKLGLVQKGLREEQ